MKHYPASHAPALAGILDCLTQRPCKPVATLVLRRSTAVLIAAVIAAFFFFLGAYAFGRALVAQDERAVGDRLKAISSEPSESEPSAYSLQPTASQP